MFVATTAVGNVMIATTSNRGHTPEELAERCAERLISVSQDAHPALRDQALAFKADIYRAADKVPQRSSYKRPRYRV